MNLMDLTMPVTLVVKAPNQKIADQTIECDYEWTIKKLKEHLSSVYPNKPREHHQKLIYSGRLLHDHLTLKDVLRVYDEEQTTHTVHLVCAQSYEQHDTTEATPVPTNQSTPPASSVRRRQTHSTTPDRTVTTSAPVTTAGPAAPPATPVAPDHAAGAFQQMMGENALLAGNPMMGAAAYGGFYPGMYSPEQMMWMQQMYAQQMAQFMQYYQVQGAAPAVTPVHTPAQHAPTNVAAPANQNAPAAAPRGEQPIRMNAQGGAVLDDDEDEFGQNRDWLDWIYTMSRLAVLLSIVYFYSTFGRFLVVFSFFFIVYLYQAGWLNMWRPRRAQPQDEQAGEEAQENEQNEAQVINQEEQDVPAEEDPATPTEPATPPPPPPPSSLRIAWSFFSTFFSSLIPQQPPAVNAN